MTYQRMRGRNGLLAQGPLSLRKSSDDPDPYFRNDRIDPRVNLPALVGDMNRMERDYTDPVYPEPPFTARVRLSDPASEAAEATGVPVEDVRKVMRYVFFEQK